MLKPNIIKYNSVRYLLLLLTLLSIGFPVTVQAQEIEPTEEEQTEPNTTSSNQLDSIFSIEGGNRLMAEADQAIDAQQYDLAAEKLQSARQVFNQLSNFYLQLFNSFTGLDNAAAESHRKKALETSIERDNATYQLALVHRAQNQPELSIPLLVQIVTSQSPGIGLGKKAYEQLLEIGFVDTPLTIPQPGNTPPQTPQTPQTPNAPPSGNGQPPTPEVQPAIPNPAPQ
ncbi:hypothetical protein IQ255_17880 [Pleurocapsales cyanobacterium LEGE 10410]|nr:hypothetical protein [Pleurocapsales cyanobacterium LEGE 10410]